MVVNKIILYSYYNQILFRTKIEGTRTKLIVRCLNSKQNGG